MDAFDAISYKDQKGDFNVKDEELLISLLRSDLISPERVLDIGCGDGLLTRRVKETFPETKIIALDNSSEQIGLASQESHAGVTFLHQDVANFETDTLFDAAYSFYAFPHIPKSQLETALKAVRKVLKTGSPFYLFTNVALFDTKDIPKEDQEACDITFLDGFISQINLISEDETLNLFAKTRFEIISDQKLETGGSVKEYGQMISWLFVLK